VKGVAVDSTEYPSLGRLARLNAQLAVQAARVGAVVSGQLDQFERLFRAAAKHDWEAVDRVSRELATQPPSGDVNASLARTAGKVCEALRLDPTGAQASRPLAKLLDACRAAKRTS
jgi:hypothetical protein